MNLIIPNTAELFIRIKREDETIDDFTENSFEIEKHIDKNSPKLEVMEYLDKNGEKALFSAWHIYGGYVLETSLKKKYQAQVVFYDNKYPPTNVLNFLRDKHNKDQTYSTTFTQKEMRENDYLVQKLSKYPELQEYFSA